MAARFALAVSCGLPDQRFETIDDLADALLAMIADQDDPSGRVTLRDANLARGGADSWDGECVSARRGIGLTGDLVAYVLTRPPGRDDRTRLMAALSRADDRLAIRERNAA